MDAGIMRRKSWRIVTFAVILLAILLVSTFILLNAQNDSMQKPTRVACVGDSLTQSSRYPYDLWIKLGKEDYALSNFGVGGTTISLNTETPYMDTSAYQEALDFQPDILILMLGTNDAQPNLKENNVSLTSDYIKLISAFNELPSKPDIYIVLPPPIVDGEFMNLNSEYFAQTIIPSIQQAAEQTGLQTIDVYSALVGNPEYYEDGVHVNDDGAEIIASEVYKAINK